MDENEYDRQQIENLADTMGLQIERNKIILDSSEKLFYESKENRR